MQRRSAFIRHFGPSLLKSVVACLVVSICIASISMVAFAEPSESETGTIQYSGDLSDVKNADTTLEDSVKGTVTDDKQNIAIEGLINGGDLLNGLIVTFEGEVIGNDVNADEGFKWVTLYDAGASIAVYMKDADASKITHRGRYGAKGDTLKVIGTFSLDCQAHQGDTDVHAISVEVTSKGYELEHEVDMTRLIIGCSIFLAAAILALVYRYLRERLR